MRFLIVLFLVGWQINLHAQTQMDKDYLRKTFRHGKAPSQEAFQHWIEASYFYIGDGLQVDKDTLSLRGLKAKLLARMQEQKAKLKLLDSVLHLVKTKTDTLNFTEENYTHYDSVKLSRIDSGANLYRLPMAGNRYGVKDPKLGGIRLGKTLSWVGDGVEVNIDPSNVEREYAQNKNNKPVESTWSITKLDSSYEWTRMRIIHTTEVANELVRDTGDWSTYRMADENLESMLKKYFYANEKNLAIKQQAVNAELIEGTGNVIVGNKAANLLKEGHDNTVLGHGSFDKNDGSKNTIVGSNSGQLATNESVVVGYGASNKSDYQSVVLGNLASAQGENKQSVAVGYQTAQYNAGLGNIAIGYQALQGKGSHYNSTTHNNDNITIGTRAGKNLKAATGNIFIGTGSGKTNQGSHNVVIGSEIDLEAQESNKIKIGNKGEVLIHGDLDKNTVSLPTLNIQHQTAINANNQFVGAGGVSTPGAIRTESTFEGRGAVPIGTIVMWSGSINRLPPGWVLCAGNSTYFDPYAKTVRTVPDLRGRFIAGHSGKGDYSSIGVPPAKKGMRLTKTKVPLYAFWSYRSYYPGSTEENLHPQILQKYNVGDKFWFTPKVPWQFSSQAYAVQYEVVSIPVGQDTYKLTKDQLPAHQHEMSENGASVSISNSGDHTHEYKIHDKVRRGDYADDAYWRMHGHKTTYTTTGSGKHSHATSDFTGNTGNGVDLKGASIDNRPNFYVLAFIIRVR